jgi:hypothetical protein
MAAIYATVRIRGDMHNILAKDQKVEQLQNSMEDEDNPFAETESKTDIENSDNGNGFAEDDNGFAEEETASTNNTDKDNSKLEQIDELTNEVNNDKGKTAWLFSIINLFIVVGGVFLSYETHTSSRIYETIEKHLEKLEKLKKNLEKELKKTDDKIMNFKNREVNTLFKKVLLKAALYDKEVRTYNTYMQIFQLKMQLIEDYIKKIYEEKGWSYSEISYIELLNKTIKLDIRNELHHVNNIEEYMIYHYNTLQKRKKDDV